MKKEKRLYWIQLFHEVTEFMEGNLEKWNGIDEIRRSYDEFRYNLKKISELQPELEQDLSPIETELAEKRELMLQRLFPLGNILEVYAQDHKLGKKAGYIIKKQKNLSALNDKELLKHCIRLYKLVDKYLHRVEVLNVDKGTVSPGQDIRRYGVNQKIMDECNSAVHQYESAIHLRKDVSIYRKKVRSELDNLIRSNRKLLSKRMNKLMSVFSGTHPGFYEGYVKITSVA